MIGLVVTGHGHFADGIHTSAQMIAGENEYVRYINFEEGMTPEQLAEKLNVSRQAISKWEMGTIPDMENMVKIGRYFDCSLDYLLNDELETNCTKEEGVQGAEGINKAAIRKGISIAAIAIGAILSLLMPLFAKLYQAFEFQNTGHCFTNSYEYILRFPLLGILLLAILFFVVGIVLFSASVRRR